MWAVLFTVAISLQAAAATSPHIAVLGGNGFMGADAVELMLRYGYNVTIINRGSWYWDAKDRIFPRVQKFTCDRNEGLQKCESLMKYLDGEGSGIEFDAVVDFSAYRPGQVADSTKVFGDKTKVYILISTDSVYDVSKMKDESTPYKEEESVPPENEDEKEHYKQFTYGINKLVVEDEMQKSGVPYVILRLPDVIGPRDATHRWWIYQVWMQLSAYYPDRPVGLPEFLQNYKMSLVYSPDVARVIIQLIKNSDVRDEIFNLAWPESMSLKEMLDDMKNELGLDSKIAVKVWEDNTKKFFMYPSGRRGPIDVKKAMEMLRFNPTPWKQAIKATVSFFESAMHDARFERQRDEIVQMVENEIFKDVNKTEFYRTLEKIYNINLNHFMGDHDEL